MCLQRSLEDEINRTTAEDLPIFAISYLVTFLYIALALGRFSSWRRVLVRGGRVESGAAGSPGPLQYLQGSVDHQEKHTSCPTHPQ